MKSKLFAIGLFLFALAACIHLDDRSVETRLATPNTSYFIASPENIALQELSAIDSLMWQRPDSALCCLLPYFDTCCRDALNASPDNVLNASPDNVLNASPDNATDTTRRNHCVSTTAYNRHYAHLLLSELLYKNDYAQTNRTELQQTVTYFDSLIADTRGVSLQGQVGCCRDTSNVSVRRASTKNATQTNIFLDARAHYINGVGYYENDSAVQACAEYLKTLEIMENHFEEKELIGHKARFMAYTYNRLGDMFSEQFMMEPSIDCYQNALVFCKIEPTSPTGVSNILYRLGKQYDKMGEKIKAKDYYEQAINGLPNNYGLLFRDLVSTKALCDYQLGEGVEQLLNTFRQINALVDNENEYLLRCLTMGGVFFKEMMYDSALLYLVPVFENKENIIIQIQAADYLRIIYDSLGNEEKSDECVRFLANHVKTESHNKALVSQLENLFQNYMNGKIEKKNTREKHKAVSRTMKILVPIVLVVAAVVVAVSRKKNKKNLVKLEAEAMRQMEKRAKQYEKALEAEQRAHRMEQAALSGRLKRSNQEIRELKDQIKQLDDLAAKTEVAASFDEEPVCRLIMDRVNKGQFKSKVDYIIYKDSALDKQQLLDLRLAADRHFGHFTTRLKKAYPELTNGDLDYCCLYLLGLTDADIAALMQRAYNTVVERDNKIEKILGSEKPLSITLMDLALNNISI